MSGQSAAILPSPPRGVAASYEISLSWSCSARACAPLLGLDPSHFSTHDCAQVALNINAKEAMRAAIEIYVQCRNVVKIISSCSVQLMMIEDGGMTHIDAVAGDRNVLALTLNAAGELLYVRSCLISELMPAGGRCDPPTIVVQPRMPMRGLATR